MSTLFDPIAVGDLSLPNRIWMAPLTRCRSGASRVPNALMAEYYAQRASAGLILSEATVVSPEGIGYADTPGIWSDAQVEGWRGVTRAVHAAGGRIFLQLWHVGRISHPKLLDGAQPVAPSAIAPAGRVSMMRPETPFVVPRALELDEIPRVISDFRCGAEHARAAGFDGVELHGANGYLVDQFLQSKSNARTDAYGGPVEGRARFMLEIVDAVIAVWGPGRVGVHLAPRSDSHDMGDADPARTFGYVAEQLGRRRIAFICAREHAELPRLGPAIKRAFGGVFVANERHDQTSASALIAAQEADAVAFGRLFIANPDLPRRFAEGSTLNPPRSALFYIGGAEGYTDYPASSASPDAAVAR